MSDLLKASENPPIAGVDEVGRGPLVGDVVAAAVILNPEDAIDGLADSKRLSEKRREQLHEQIIGRALSVGIGRASPKEIDELNILHASMLAMRRAVEALHIQPATVLVDGNRLPKWPYVSRAIVKGDQLVAEISAASIVAKVTRDREMHALAKAYPDYGFDRHKGYPTQAHMEALVRLGPLPEHRRSFAPVRRLLTTEATE